MKQYGFTFDINKCVGCHACSIACSIENNLGYDTHWRQIITYNPDRIEFLNHYHLSLACNHCVDAVCLEQCPAKAIHKKRIGIVLIDDNKCIGCKFCSWVCPYDAPQYVEHDNVMTKCTFCAHRIEDGLKPACVSICPTNALEFENIEVSEKSEEIAGFPPSTIKPVIKLAKPIPGQSLPDKVDLPYSQELIANYTKKLSESKSKISARNEWTLILFTLLTAVLGGYFSTWILSGSYINPYMFLLVGILGMGLSTFHLGKKFRAYRAVLNLRSSWLSTEILSVSLFLGFAAITLITNIHFFGYIALILAFISAMAMDKVYSVTAQTNKRSFHSAQILLSLILFMVLFNKIIVGIILVSTIKLILYIKRNIVNGKLNASILFFTRICTLILVLVFILIDFTYWYYSVICLVIISELIDRIQFYNELDIITPVKHMESNFKKSLNIYNNGK